MCAPPDFTAQASGVGVPLIPKGYSVRELLHGQTPVTPADAPRVAADLVAMQFDTVAAAAAGCDALVSAGLMPAGERSIAGEQRPRPRLHRPTMARGRPDAQSMARVAGPRRRPDRYWARRVADLGIGAAHDGPTPTTESLSAPLRTALTPETRARAAAVAKMIRTDGSKAAQPL